jgi:SAM-dependent methyltransferase
MPCLADFEHRASYADGEGRDVWIVRAIGAWMDAILPPLLASAARGPVLDVGCGEQPFRRAIVASGCRYVGMDVVQNAAGTVDAIGAVDALPEPWPLPDARYPLVICTEVLEHVSQIEAAFANLRRLTAPSGVVVVTTPFMFPMHMEPSDYRRLTVHGLERLASANRFRIERLDRLGTPAHAATTLLADLSILPARRSVRARARVVALRAAVRAGIRCLARVRDDVVINGNAYLGNGAVLRAES